MAALTAVVVRRSCKLALVDVRMAVPTLTEFDLVERGFSCRDMTLGARNGDVLRLQGVGGIGVFGHSKLRGFESIHGVAWLAGAAIFARAELPAVGIGSMAIGAFGMRQGVIECRAVVAYLATHLDVLAQQWVVGFGVIEGSRHAIGGDLFPVGLVVAGFTPCLEAAVVRVVMARRTLLEGEPNVLNDFWIGGCRLVTLFAGHLRMRFQQGVLGLRVVETRSLLPIVERVAAETIFPQLPTVRVDMAGEAITGQAKKSAVQILGLDECALGLGNILGVVALPARKLCVLALQDTSRLVVIEGVLRRLPMNNLEILSVVFGVASHAIFV